MKFLSPEFALHLYKSNICPCREYCCHAWADAPSCYLELLEKLQKRISRTVVLHLLLLFKPWLINESLVFSIGITLVDVHLNWFNWLHFLFLKGGLLVILIDCMIFLSPFIGVTRMSTSTISFFTQLDSGILCIKNAFL